MLSRKDRLEIAQLASAILRDSGALDRVKHGGYTRIDPFKIATDADLAVMKRPLDTLLGGFVRDERSGILINTERPAGQVHMTCAHELGHYFLGHGTTFDDEFDNDAEAPYIERQADWFAYNLLIPRFLVIDLMRRKGWRPMDLQRPEVLYQLSLRLGTSFTATYWTLRSLELIRLGAGEQHALLKTPLQRLKRQLAASGVDETLTDVWLLDDRDRDRVLEPRVGDRFIVDLPNHASAGYLWSLEELAAEGFTLRPLALDESHLAGGSPDETIVGGGSTLRYSLETEDVESAVLARRLSLRFAERRPWRPNEVSDSVELSTEFEILRHGLDERSREKLLQGVLAP